MSVIYHGDFGINYDEYRLGNLKQYFRGPKPDMSAPFITMLGGGETFGRFVQRPFAELVGDELPLGTVNLGLNGVGPTFYLRDTVLLDTCTRSKLCVMSVPHGYGVSNRLYSVLEHSNNQLKGVSETLLTLYPNINFQSFSSIQSMLQALYKENAANFKVVTIELRRAWVARMRELIETIAAPVILVWFSDKKPEEARFDGVFKGTGPQMVDRVMLDRLQGYPETYLEYVASKDCVNQDCSDRVFNEGELSVARQYPGGDMHRQLAEILYPAVRNTLRARTPHRQALRKTMDLLGF